MKNFSIDINADVGEGVDNEAELMPFLSSCNIACGGHAGEPETLRRVIELAKSHNVKIGAHPSFPDRANFGRQIMQMTDEELEDTIVNQIFGVKITVESYGLKLDHVKLHGALYNLAAVDEKLATLVVNVIKKFHYPLKLYAPFGSVISKIAQQEGIEVMYEGFADRNYNEDLSLVSRKNKNAILHKKEAILTHVLKIIKQQKVRTISGVEVPIKATTICVHGDTKNAVEILEYLSYNLKNHNIRIQ